MVQEIRHGDTSLPSRRREDNRKATFIFNNSFVFLFCFFKITITITARIYIQRWTEAFHKQNKLHLKHVIKYKINVRVKFTK